MSKPAAVAQPVQQQHRFPASTRSCSPRVCAAHPHYDNAWNRVVKGFQRAQPGKSARHGGSIKVRWTSSLPKTSHNGVAGLAGQPLELSFLTRKPHQLGAMALHNPPRPSFHIPGSETDPPWREVSASGEMAKRDQQKLRHMPTASCTKLPAPG